MSGHGYLAGLAWLVATYGLVAVATAAVLRRRLAGLDGAPRVVAGAVVFTAGVLAAHVVPLALGVLARGTVLASAALLATAALAAPARQAALAPPVGAAEDVGSRLVGALAAVAVAAVAATWLVALVREAAQPVTALDTLTFHLPNVARWIQHGTLWRVDQFIPGLAQGNYPQNGDAVTLSVVLPWRDVFAARLLVAAYYALTGAAVYALARELGARVGEAALAGALVLALPVVAWSAVRNAMPDAVMYSTFAAGLLFAARHARGRARADLVLAGVALGISFGTKWYAVSAVVAAAAVFVVAGRVAVRQAALLAALVGGAGGIWLVRNLVESGDPAFPQRVAPLGITLFDAPPDPIRERAGFRVADYLFAPGVWRHYLAPAYRLFLSAPGALLLVALAGVALAAVVRRRVPARIAALAALGVALVVIYAITPYSAFGPRDRPFFAAQNSRYVVPALIVAAGVGAWALGRLGRARAGVAALALAAVVLGLRRGYDVPPAAVVAVAAALLGAGAALRRAAPPRAALVAVGLLALVIGGARVKDRFDARGYAGRDPTIDWILARAPAGARIGLAGIFEPAALPPVLPAFGARLGNDVRYVGPWVRHRLEQYRTATAFRAALRAGRYDLLLVGRGSPPADVTVPERWAMAAGWSPVARGGAMTLLRAPKSLSDS